MKRICSVLLLFSLLSAAGWAWQFFSARQRAANRFGREWVQNPLPERDGDRHNVQYPAEYLLEYNHAGRLFHHWRQDHFASIQSFPVEAALGNFAPGARTTVCIDPDHPERVATATTGLSLLLHRNSSPPQAIQPHHGLSWLA